MTSIASVHLSTTDATSHLQAGFHALSDPIRFRVLEILREGEHCVCDLNHHLQLSQSRLSFHLRVLKEAKLVNVRQEGRWAYYSINNPGFEPLQATLAVFQSSNPSICSACS
jgi:ArsR family transcriptional regulator, arsenate/arsenite/antimonite-responsive transcriptional repressor